MKKLIASVILFIFCVFSSLFSVYVAADKGYPLLSVVAAALGMMGAIGLFTTARMINER